MKTIAGSTFLSADEILAIPPFLCPMVVFSDSLRGFFSWAIKVHEHGCYNHAMWLLPGNLVASQNMVYQKQPIQNYIGNFRLKLWYCPDWTAEERKIILAMIEKHVSKPWYKRVYDVPAIFGQLLHLDFIQTPGLDICSDSGAYLKLVDPQYNLKHPDPEEVNHWLEGHTKYKVYGRYVPD